MDNKDYISGTLRVGDLNGDGAPELLFVRNIRSTREIACLTAVDIYGNVIWQNEVLPGGGPECFCDLPVQIYDWDGDGRNEVLWVEQAEYLEFTAYSYNPSDKPIVMRDISEIRGNNNYYVESAELYGKPAVMHVLDGAVGHEKYAFPIPLPADDSFLFANLTGGQSRRDLIVKDRYDNIWGLNRQGEVLWKWSGSTGHYPAIADVDGDGMDEVFTGFALTDHDGKTLWKTEVGQWIHADATYITQLNGEFRLFFGNHGVHCMGLDGREIWKTEMDEAQHVLAGCFQPYLGPVQVAVLERGQIKKTTDVYKYDSGDIYYGQGRAPSVLRLLDWDGKEIWSREQPAGSWAAGARVVNWIGEPNARQILVTARGENPAAVYDGYGNIINKLGSESMVPADTLGAAADVYGDSRDEIVLTDGAVCEIYANTDPCPVPSLYNYTLYMGM